MPISNRDDVIDSRDVIARIEDLEAAREELQNAFALAEGEEARNDAEIELNTWDDSDDAQELAALKALAEQAEGYADDWTHGAALIRDSYFEQYAQELAEDIGAIDSNASWPHTCIDWERAARELRMDYTCVNFDGVDYWVR